MYCIFPQHRADKNTRTKEQTYETIKIMELPESTPISATCVRVPVERTHCESIQVITRDEVSLDSVRQALSEAPGLTVLDAPEKDIYPTPLEATGQDDVFVGRIRRPYNSPRATDIYLAGDQILKGAALNAVQIAELVFKN